MALVTGEVEAYSTKYDKYSILVNGVWYSSKFEFKASKGDTVQFDDGGRKYVQKLKVLSGGGAGGSTSSSQARSAKPGFPVAVDTKDRSIVRQNSLTHATTLVCNVFKGSWSSDNEVQSWEERQDQLDNLAQEIVRVARIFEDYSSGDGDYEEAKKALEDS